VVCNVVALSSNGGIGGNSYVVVMMLRSKEKVVVTLSGGYLSSVSARGSGSFWAKVGFKLEYSRDNIN
jgi:uncharacterized membrane protein